MLLNDYWVIEEIKGETRKFLESNEKEKQHRTYGM
jgi:hypothetical protein